MSGSPDAARGPLHPKPAGTENARPKQGDRVRVVIEGPVFRNCGAILEVGNIQSRFTVPSGLVGIPGGTVSVEVLPPPEPAWWPPEVGDVIEIHESAYLRRPQRWINGNGATYTDDEILERVSGVTLLVRNGKAL